MSLPNLNPIVGAVEAGANAIEKVAGVFTSNAEKDAQRSADEQIALLQSYHAEFNTRQNRTWMDAFADGFNRLVRPFIVFMVLSIFIIAYVSPTQFALIGTAMGAIPNGYWALLSVVVGFYFGGRMQLKRQDFEFQKSQVAAVKQLIEAKGAFRKLEMDRDEPDRVIGDKAAKHEAVSQSRSTQRNKVIDAFVKAAPEQRDAALKQTVQKMLDQDTGEGVDILHMEKYRAQG